MKKILRQFAIWLLEKTDKQELKRMKIGVKTTVNFSKYLPKNNKWYHVAFTYTAFMQRNGEKMHKVDDLCVFIDGLEKKYSF